MVLLDRQVDAVHEAVQRMILPTVTHKVTQSTKSRKSRERGRGREEDVGLKRARTKRRGESAAETSLTFPSLS